MSLATHVRHNRDLRAYHIGQARKQGNGTIKNRESSNSK
jgi:hypothetical protein